MKHYYKLGFANRSALEQLAICRRVADSAAKLPAEQREALAELAIAAVTDEAAAACADVETAKAALKTALHRRKTKLRDRARPRLQGRPPSDHPDRRLAATFLAAGLGVVKEKQPVGVPSAPERLRAPASDFEGRVKLRWKRPVRRCAFLIEMTTDPSATTGWQQVAISGNRQSCEVAGLVGGMKCWFRVAATNAHGQGPWSQPVSAWVK